MHVQHMTRNAPHPLQPIAMWLHSHRASRHFLHANTCIAHFTSLYNHCSLPQPSLISLLLLLLSPLFLSSKFMANSSLALLAATLCLLVHAAFGKGYATTGLSEAQQCRLRRIRATQPDQRIESEAGVSELWSEDDEQFQCAGVAAVRNILRPNALFLPEFINAPRLVFIERGRGILGITYPGCPETYHSDRSSGGGGGGGGRRGRRGWQEEGQQGESGRRDQHQKVHRIRRGDIIAIPEGAVHWCHNDGDEELVAITVIDLNNQGNQLDQRLRVMADEIFHILCPL